MTADAAPRRRQAAVSRYWMLSAAVAGFAAGIPWAWVLAGLLPAFIFAIVAALSARAQWSKPGASDRWWAHPVTAGACGALVGATVGGLFSYTWPDPELFRCFSLQATPVLSAVEKKYAFDMAADPWDYQIRWVAGAAGAGLITFGVVGLVVRRNARRWAYGHCEPVTLVRSLSAGATLSLAASFAWSLTNEWLLPNWPAFLRDDCNPDLGPIAVVGYLSASAGFAAALRSSRPQPAPVGTPYRGGPGAHPGLTRRRHIGMTVALWTALALVGLQLARSFEIRRYPPAGDRRVCDRCEKGGQGFHLDVAW
jgi:hypothetical protein